MPQFLKQYGEQLVALGYTVLPIRPGTKRPDLKNWPNHNTTVEDVVAWYSNGRANHGAGVNARNTPAIDVDVLDPGVAQQMSDAIDAIFGPGLWTRTGLYPKFLVPFRSDTPFRKMSSAIYTDGKNEHKVEILGDGQQWVAYHIHPDTEQPYRWFDGCTDDGIRSVARSALPELDAGHAQLVIDAFERIASGLVAQGKWAATVSVERVRSDTPHSDDPFADQPLKLTDKQADWLIAQCDPSNYGEWVDVGMMLHHQHAGSPEALEKWREWSSAADNYAPDQVDGKWESFGHRTDRPVTFRKLLQRFGQPPADKPKALEMGREFAFYPGDEYSEDFIGGPEIVEDVFPAQGTGMIFGPSGSGKTFWMLDMAFHVQNGQKWRDKDVRKGDVMYIAAEAGRGIKKRIRGVMNARPGWRAPFFADLAPDLSDTNWIQKIRDAAQAAGHPAMVVIDTMSASFAGDDSSQADVAPMIRNLTSLSMALECLVVFVHHTTKEGGSFRGSGAFYNDVDAVLELIPAESEERKQWVTQRKHRDGEAGKSYPFTLVLTAPVGKKPNGKDITTMIVEQADYAPVEKRKEKRSTGGDFETSDKYAKARKYLQIIEELVGLGDANADEIDVISAIQANDVVNPLKEPDYPRADNIKRTLLTLAERGKIRREGRWIRLCR